MGNGNEQMNQILMEIMELRNDFREDVNSVYDKIDRNYEKLRDKIDDQRSCLVEKVDKLRDQRETCVKECTDKIDGVNKKKLDGKWFRYLLYGLFSLIIIFGGAVVWNKVEVGKLNTAFAAYQEHSTEKFKDLSKKIDEAKELIKNGNHAPKTVPN